jgi:hypothetical protein
MRKWDDVDIGHVIWHRRRRSGIQALEMYSRRTRAVLIMRCDDELTQQNYGTTGTIPGSWQYWYLPTGRDAAGSWLEPSSEDTELRSEETENGYRSVWPYFDRTEVLTRRARLLSERGMRGWIGSNEYRQPFRNKCHTR